MGIKESDTGLAPPNLWDVAADKQRMGEEHPLQVRWPIAVVIVIVIIYACTSIKQVARCTKIIKGETEEDGKYVINIKQIAKFVVGLGEKVSPTDVEEGMRVGW
jgi:26S proteasome regulatory subunit T1